MQLGKGAGHSQRTATGSATGHIAKQRDRETTRCRMVYIAYVLVSKKKKLQLCVLFAALLHKGPLRGS